MIYQNILVTNKSGICYITINRPKQLNALNKQTILELNDSILAANKDIKTRCIILTGSEKRAFVAGADIKEFSNFNKQQGEELARSGQDLLFDTLENIGTPTIAAINGFALGGGLEMALSCHIRIASNNAKMGLPETSLGLIPGYGGTQRLSKLIGRGRALEVIMTAKMFSAEDALKWGLVNRICPEDKLLAEAEKIAQNIMNNSPNAIEKAIKSVNAGFIDGINGFEVEKKLFGACFDSPEFKEGTTAFIEKRKANF